MSGDYNMNQKITGTLFSAAQVDAIEREWREKCETYKELMDARGFSTGYKRAMKDVVDLLMIQHEAAKGTHNYWHVAANLVKAEFLSEEGNHG